MSDDSRARFSLRRWSQRKHEASRNDAAGNEAPTLVDERPDAVPPPASRAAPNAASITGAAAAPSSAAVADPGASARAQVAPAQRADAPLPPVESLTFDSDFTAFMRAGVDPDVKRAALRKLLRDARFNVMDGLDVYIDDYSKPDPIDPAIVRTLMQARYVFAPPKTRVNADGHVEDVPSEEPVAPDVLASAAAAPQTATTGAIADSSAPASDTTPPAAAGEALPAVLPSERP